MRVTRPLVSVIVPAYNAAATIGATLRSVLGQTYRPLEIVVVDDGSTDRTREEAAAFGDDVRVVAQANAGDAAARNAGIRATRGEIVAFVDADDLWKSEKLERQVAILDADASVGGVHCGAVYVDADLRELEVRPAARGRVELMDVLTFRELPAFSSALVVRRSCLDRIGHVDLSLSGKDEWDLAIRVARGCGLASVAEPLVIRRMHVGSTSRHAAYASRQIAPGREILRRVFADPTLPSEVRGRRGRAYAAFYRMISGSYAQAGAWRSALFWAMRAALADPVALPSLIGALARRVRE